MVKRKFGIRPESQNIMKMIVEQELGALKRGPGTLLRTMESQVTD